MRRKRWPGLLMGVVWLCGNGCTALKEVPRSEYAAREERKAVQVTTREGLHYELDYARIQNDSLIGYRRRDVEGPVDEFDTLQLPLDQVAKLSARRIDWYRTGLIGGLSLAAIVAAGLSGHSNAPSGGGGGGGDPCPREPCP